MKKKGSKKIILISLILVIFLLCWFIMDFKFVKTIKIQCETYEDKVDFKGFYFIDEKVLYEGSVNSKDLYYKDGQQISKGAMITNSIMAAEAGMISMRIDGYEGKFNFKNIKNIKAKDIENILKENNDKPGIKIVNNSEWYVLALVDKDEYQYFKVGMFKDVVINSKKYNAEIINKFSNSEGNYLILKFKYDFDIVNLKRGIEGQIVKRIYDGFIIPESALIVYNGNKGVFVKINGYARFRRVKVVKLDNGTAVVLPDTKGINIKDYDELICNPKNIEDGRKVR